MLRPAKALAARLWPVLRLRWVLFGTLVFVAALPGFGAVFLRVYENALVRRTEAELIAQSAALSASAALLWPGAPTATAAPDTGEETAVSRSEDYIDVSTGIDLRSSPVLPERPPAQAVADRADPAALSVAGRLAPAFAETKRATLASILILDSGGIVLNGRDTAKSLAALPEVRRALAGQAVTVLRHNSAYTLRYPLEWVSRGTAIRLHHARPIVVDGKVAGVVLVSRSPRALFRGMWEDRGKIAAGVGLILMLLVGLTAVLARAIVRPIEDLSRATRALASGQPAQPRPPTLKVVEVQGLYRDFAAMAQSIEARSRYLRDFAASLSHEFKTPLAGISGAIELLQDHAETMSAAERERFLANMAGDAGRLSRLVRRLMELAQADMRAADPRARAELAPILASLADGLAGETFAIALDVPPGLGPLAIDPAALETVLATLIENARQAGAGRLAITARQSGDEAVIELIDDGPGIPSADRTRVFDPFFTSKRASGGTGLGLPIARSLIESGKGDLLLLESERGAHFHLQLPTA